VSVEEGIEIRSLPSSAPNSKSNFAPLASDNPPVSVSVPMELPGAR
jgi:hypothetical protein